MKSNVFKFSSAVFILLLVTVTVNSQSFTQQKKIVKSFALASDTEIEISNKYGDINFKNWEEDSVKIEINYKVTSTKETKLDKTFNAINFDFKANQYYIVATTVFEGGGTFWTDVSDIANNLFAGGTNTSIDYTVYVPSDKNISIKLKYGSVYLANHSGYFKLDLSNGDLKAHELSGETELDINFGDATVNSITNGQLNINYGTMLLENAGKLTLSSQSSEIELGIVDELIVDSKRDKIIVDEANLITGKTYFSRLTIDKIYNKIDLSTKYGSFKLKDIKSNVKNVQLSSINTTVSLYFNSDRDYLISIISEDKTEVSYSAKLGDFTTKVIGEKENRKQSECLYGDDNKAIPVNIDMKSGLLTLNLKN